MTDIPIGGTTGLCHETSAAIDEAATWLALTPRRQRDRPAVPLLRQRFGLTPAEACQAIAAANMILARSE
ncbi:MAG: hypothetical protein E5W74_15190 [Mesorhizobium sp.]|uniref:hypothetical protein n=1 Tax=Mesorhizobium sp. TaxID=1871066 RepID=UPI001215EB29|nr:hypothetical protein [Mesorhizobium sp.]TIT10816.1 MAG: hypothetical protein E5W74_15190 [Mesorhizobium sp.]